MAALCRDHGVTILEVVPSLAAQYVRDLAPLGADLRIRRFLTGGEALTPALVAAVYDALPGCGQVWNTYGPTETTVQVITGAIPHGAGRVPLGRPDHNVHCYVSTVPDEGAIPGAPFHPRQCGVGEPGELLLSGPRLGRGYRGRPDLTARAFVPNPFFDTTADLPPDLRQHYRWAAPAAGWVEGGCGWGGTRRAAALCCPLTATLLLAAPRPLPAPQAGVSDGRPGAVVPRRPAGVSGPHRQPGGEAARWEGASPLKRRPQAHLALLLPRMRPPQPPPAPPPPAPLLSTPAGEDQRRAHGAGGD